MWGLVAVARGGGRQGLRMICNRQEKRRRTERCFLVAEWLSVVGLMSAKYPGGMGDNGMLQAQGGDRGVR